MPIIVGYVAGSRGQAALDAALKFAKLMDESLLVVNSSSGDQRVDSDYASAQEMAEVMSKVEESGIAGELRHGVTGKRGADVVLELAAELDPSLIVIGIRRRSPTGKVLFGSNSQDILLQANCPVLAVKAD